MKDRQTTNPVIRRLVKLGVLVAVPLMAPAVSAWEILVGNGDSLMAIAKQTREAGTTTPEQQAVAIFESNPHAFLNDNMNGLQRGATLRIPGKDKAEAMSAADADALVRQHHVDWNKGVVVRNGESLMKIAAETRQSETTTVHQQALALLKANPRAFSNGNINGLRWGTKLRIPSTDVAQSIDPDTATQMVHQQNREWHRGHSASEAAGPMASSEESSSRSSKPQRRASAAPQEVTIIRGSQVEVSKVRH